MDKPEVKKQAPVVKKLEGFKDCFKSYPWGKVTKECRTCKDHADCKKGSPKK